MAVAGYQIPVAREKRLLGGIRDGNFVVVLRLRYLSLRMTTSKEKPALFLPRELHAGSQFPRSFGRAWPLIFPLTGAA
jgi:hypothetical protein